MPQHPMPNEWRAPSRRTSVLVILAVAVIARAVCLTQLLVALPFYRGVAPGFDQHVYFCWAKAIAGGDLWSRSPEVLTLNHGQGPFYFSPLYPYVLSLACLLAGPAGVVAGIVLNAVLGVFTALIVGAIARRVFGNWPGLLAGLLAALSGASLAAEGLLLHDTLITFLLLAGLLLIVRRTVSPQITQISQISNHRNLSSLREAPQSEIRNPKSEIGPALPYWLLPGLLFGLAGIGRATNLLVAGAMCLWLLLRNPGVSPDRRPTRLRRFAAATVFGLTTLAVAALPAVRNGLLFGRWTPATGGWPAAYLGLDPDNPGTLFYTARYRAAADRVQQANDQPAAWRGQILVLIRDDPAGVARTLGRKLVYFVFNSWDAPDNGNYYFVRRYVWPFAFTIGPLILYVLGFTGITTSLRPRRRFGFLPPPGGRVSIKFLPPPGGRAGERGALPGTVPLYVFGLTFAASLLGGYPAGRFKLPLLALLCVFGGYAIAALGRLLWSVIPKDKPPGDRLRFRIAGLVGLVTMLALFTAAFWPRGPWGLHFAGGTLRTNEFEYNARSLWDCGRKAEALAMLDDADAILPDTPSLAANFAIDLAESKASGGDYAGAIEELNRILEQPRHKTNARAYFTRGAVHSNIASGLTEAARSSSPGGRPGADALRQARKEDQLALDDMNRAVELDPTEASFWYGRGMLMVLIGQRDQAIGSLDQAIKLNPHRADYFYQRGWLHNESASALVRAGSRDAAVGDFTQAISDFTQAIAIDPGFADAYQMRSKSYFDRGSPGDSVRGGEDMAAYRRLQAMPKRNQE